MVEWGCSIKRDEDGKKLKKFCELQKLEKIVMKRTIEEIGRRVAFGRWGWGLKYVDGIGVIVEVVGDIGSQEVGIEEILGQVRVMGNKAYAVLMGFPKMGIPIRTGSVTVDGGKVRVEGSNLKIVFEYKMRWNEDEGMEYEEVERLMREGGLR